MATASRETSTKQEVVMSGTVCEVNRREMTFRLQPAYKVEVPAPIPERYLDTVLEAFKSGAGGARVTVRGTGRRDRQHRVLCFDSVEDVVLHEPLDVTSQLDDLRRLKDGWYDGDGFAPSHEGLDWLDDKMKDEYSGDLPCPYIYPTFEGGVQMEWSIGPYETEIEINLNDHTGEWLWIEITSEDGGEKVLNLDDSDSWAWLASEIRRLRKIAE